MRAVRCQHGKARYWVGESMPGDRLPDIEFCPVCDRNTTPLDVDPPSPSP